MRKEVLNMKFGKSKILSIVGIVIATTVSTVISVMMQDREIEKNVQKHYDTIESKKEEA